MQVLPFSTHLRTVVSRRGDKFHAVPVGRVLLGSGLRVWLPGVLGGTVAGGHSRVTVPGLGAGHSSSVRDAICDLYYTNAPRSRALFRLPTVTVRAVPRSRSHPGAVPTFRRRRAHCLHGVLSCGRSHAHRSALTHGHRLHRSSSRGCSSIEHGHGVYVSRSTLPAFMSRVMFDGASVRHSHPRCGSTLQAHRLHGVLRRGRSHALTVPRCRLINLPRGREITR